MDIRHACMQSVINVNGMQTNANCYSYMYERVHEYCTLPRTSTSDTRVPTYMLTYSRLVVLEVRHGVLYMCFLRRYSTHGENSLAAVREHNVPPTSLGQGAA